MQPKSVQNVQFLGSAPTLDTVGKSVILVFKSRPESSYPAFLIVPEFSQIPFRYQVDSTISTTIK